MTDNALGCQKYQSKLRAKVLEVLGNECVNCGFTDARALQIDHVNGGGMKHIRSVAWTQRYKAILKDTTGFQLLCANCNWIKRSIKNENAKQQKI